MEKIPSGAGRAAPRKGESRFAVVEVPAADHAAGGPRGGRPGLHALGVHRGLEDVAERVPARSGAWIPEGDVVDVALRRLVADHAAGGPRGGRPCVGVRRGGRVAGEGGGRHGAGVIETTNLIQFPFSRLYLDAGGDDARELLFF